MGRYDLSCFKNILSHFEVEEKKIGPGFFGLVTYVLGLLFWYSFNFCQTSFTCFWVSSREPELSMI